MSVSPTSPKNIHTLSHPDETLMDTFRFDFRALAYRKSGMADEHINRSGLAYKIVIWYDT